MDTKNSPKYSDQDQLLATDAAKFLGVARMTLYRYVKEKRIKGRDSGGHTRYRVADLKKLKFAITGIKEEEPRSRPTTGNFIAQKERVNQELDELIAADIKELAPFAFDKDATPEKNQENLRTQIMYLLDKYNLVPRYVALTREESIPARQSTTKDLLDRVLPKQSSTKTQVLPSSAMEQLVENLLTVTQRIEGATEGKPRVVLDGEFHEEFLPALELEDFTEEVN